MQPTELRTERLLLRPFQAGDVPASLAYRNDPEFARFLPHIPQPFTTRDAERFVAQNMSESWTTSPTFAVVLDGVLIGTVNLEVDAGRHSGLLGYAIGRAWWGRGLTTEAAWAVITWAREVYGLRRVWAEADAQNLGSQRVLEKLGMRYEHFRTAESLRRDGTPSSSVRYGLNFSE